MLLLSPAVSVSGTNIWSMMNLRKTNFGMFPISWLPRQKSPADKAAEYFLYFVWDKNARRIAVIFALQIAKSFQCPARGKFIPADFDCAGCIHRLLKHPPNRIVYHIQQFLHIFGSLVSGGFLARKVRFDLLFRYAAAAANLYGVISQYDFNKRLQVSEARLLICGGGYCGEMLRDKC